LLYTYVEPLVPTDTDADVALAYTLVVPILNPAADTFAPPLLLIVAVKAIVAAEALCTLVDVNANAENKGTVVLPEVSACVAVVVIIIFVPAFW